MKKYYLLIMLLLTGCSEFNKRLGLSSGGGNGGGNGQSSTTFLVAGQSNGTSGAQGTQGPIVSITGRVVIHDQAGFDGVPSSSNPSPFSVTWVYLGDMLAGSLNGPIEFVNISRGNTSTQQWIDNGWYKDIGPKARASGVCAVLWVQGESDGSQNLGVEVTYQNMRQMILDSRKYAPNLKWYVALDSLVSDNPRIAQQRLIAERLVESGPDIDAMRATELGWFEPHYTMAGAEFSNVEGFKGHAAAWYKILTASRPWLK